MTDELRIQLLGSIQITRNGVPIDGFISNKARGLFCYAAVTGRVHQRESLANLLWGEVLESSAKASLRVALHNLRQLFPSHLTITRHTVAWNQESAYWLDVEEFQAAFRSGSTTSGSPTDIQSLRAAIDLYQGNFLEGLQTGEPDFEDWVLQQREQLKQFALQALHTLATHYLTQNEYSLGIDYTSRLLVIEPWLEEAHRLMMRLLARSGRRSAALAQYESCRQLLATELGVEPTPETTALYERIYHEENLVPEPTSRQPAESALAPPPNQVPHQPVPFVGRQKELAQIAEFWAQSGRRLLVLFGFGGMGKTSLALRAAQDLPACFRHGIQFVQLEEAERLELALAAALSLAPAPQASLETEILRHLQDKEMLLILDGFERFLPQAPLLVRLLKLAPGLKVLVTSTVRLNLLEAQSIEVKGLPVPDCAHAENLMQYAAVQLFLEHAHRVSPEFCPTEEEMACIALICQLVEGMPLGIALAAAWMRMLSSQEIAREVKENLDFLANSLIGLPQRHHSLRANFQYCRDLLEQRERGLLKRLLSFPGAFKREAVEAAVAGSFPILAALVDKSFLHKRPDQQFEMPLLVRRYVGEEAFLAD